MWRRCNTLILHVRGERLQHARRNTLILIVRATPEDLDGASRRARRVIVFVDEYYWKYDVGDGANFTNFHSLSTQAGEEVAREMSEGHIARDVVGDGASWCDTGYFGGDRTD